MIASVITVGREVICPGTALKLPTEELEEEEEAAEEMNALHVDQQITSRETVRRKYLVDRMERRTCAATTAMKWVTCLVTAQLRQHKTTAYGSERLPRTMLPSIGCVYAMPEGSRTFIVVYANNINMSENINL